MGQGHPEKLQRLDPLKLNAHQIEIVGLDGSPLRKLVLDPTKDTSVFLTTKVPLYDVLTHRSPMS